MTLNLILLSQETSGDVNLQPSPFSCLDRSQKERIATCFDQNFACHQALEKAGKPTTDWEILLLAIAGGLVGGMLLDSRLHH